jgi:hypothetical protein
VLLAALQLLQVTAGGDGAVVPIGSSLVAAGGRSRSDHRQRRKPVQSCCAARRHHGPRARLQGRQRRCLAAPLPGTQRVLEAQAKLSPSTILANGVVGCRPDKLSARREAFIPYVTRTALGADPVYRWSMAHSTSAVTPVCVIPTAACDSRGFLIGPGSDLISLAADGRGH